MLASFDVVVFFFTSGDGSNGPLQVAGEKAAFESFIKNGGGYVGIHSATDTYQTSWPFYKLLVGAAFVNHPAVQIATMRFESHQTTQGIPSPWVLSDEWYNFDYAFPEFRQTVQVLIFTLLTAAFYFLFGYPSSISSSPLRCSPEL